jgi:hypothetical protein
LEEVRFLESRFDGWFQRERYVYADAAGSGSEPVDRMRVKALITHPVEGVVVEAGSVVGVRGLAWSGMGGVSRVDFSADGGRTWQDAALGPPIGGEARRFAFDWSPRSKGQAVLLARARDASGRQQPSEAPWNRFGYGQNAVVPRRVRVV